MVSVWHGSVVYWEDHKTFWPMSSIRSVTATLLPHWEISSQHFQTFPICVKIFHSQYYLAALVFCVQSVHSEMNSPIHHNVERLVRQKNKKKFGTAVTAVCRGYLFTCRRFTSPDVDDLHSRTLTLHRAHKLPSTNNKYIIRTCNVCWRH